MSQLTNILTINERGGEYKPMHKKNCIFLHCLPRGKEVEEDVFLSKKSKVWQQALNRVHVQKSILLYCFGKLR